MQIVSNIPRLQKIIHRKKLQRKSVGFVPTMGALHEGHLSLIRKARRENDIVVLSIFVNPKQFGPKEDLSSYPRSKKRDVLLAKKEKVDIIFYPSEKSIYPDRYLTTICVSEITERLCGRSRPGHFLGVATIVGKLLNIVSPDQMYLGQKDAQQCAVLKQMVRDLNWSCAIRVLPIIREKDGLAMSSRNQYLSPEQRRQSTILYQSLKAARARIREGERAAPKICQLVRRMVRSKPLSRIEYVACVNADTLKPVKRLKGRILIALAVKFGRARLIDNMICVVK